MTMGREPVPGSRIVGMTRRMIREERVVDGKGSFVAFYMSTCGF